MLDAIKKYFSVKYISIRRKQTSFHGLGGWSYEYKIMPVKDYYGNSTERLFQQWEVCKTLTNGDINNRA